jgi:polygalacturonase
MQQSQPMPFDMPPIQTPSFPERTFDVRGFDAVGDGATLNTAAFGRAIEACHGAGGGVVLVPAGTWLTGPIHLQLLASDICFGLHQYRDYRRRDV